MPRLPIDPPTPPGYIRRILGRPPAEMVRGIEVQVDEGEIMDGDTFRAFARYPSAR